MPKLRAESIPLSVVHLSLPQPTLEQVKGLLATRHKRELRSVFFRIVESADTAAVAAELVSTDPLKLWTYRGSFSDDEGTAFCEAVVSSRTATRCNSLTALDLSVALFDPTDWSTLLPALPELTSFRVHYADVIPSCHCAGGQSRFTCVCVFGSRLQVEDLGDIELADAEAWSRTFRNALLWNTTLHTFDYSLMDLSHLRDVARHNHSLIVLSEETGFADSLLFNRVSARLCLSRGPLTCCFTVAFGCDQILRWNWSRVVLALSSARSVAPIAFALRFSILPLIDSIMHFAFDRGVEPILVRRVRLSAEHECEIQRSTISLPAFTRTKYFEAELQRYNHAKTRVRKTPDS